MHRLGKFSERCAVDTKSLDDFHSFFNSFFRRHIRGGICRGRDIAVVRALHFVAYVAVCCSVLQCTTARGSAVQSVAECCRVLQSAAVRCIALQCTASVKCLKRSGTTRNPPPHTHTTCFLFSPPLFSVRILSSIMGSVVNSEKIAALHENVAMCCGV